MEKRITAANSLLESLNSIEITARKRKFTIYVKSDYPNNNYLYPYHYNR